MIDDLARDRADEERLDAAQAPVADDDEVAPEVARRLDDDRRRATAPDGRLDDPAGTGQRVGGVVDDPGRVGAERALERLGFVDVHRPGAGDRARAAARSQLTTVTTKSGGNGRSATSLQATAAFADPSIPSSTRMVVPPGASIVRGGAAGRTCRMA